MAWEIDWIAAGTWMQAAAGFAGAAAVVWVGNGTKNAFGTWLQQKQTERRLDVAERLLFLVHRVDDVFSHIRNPVCLGNELQAAEDLLNVLFENNIPEDRLENLRTCQVILSRIDLHGEFWVEYNSLRPKIRGYFGLDVYRCYENIGLSRLKISAAAKSYSYLGAGVMDRDLERLQKDSDKYKAIFWEGWADIVEKQDEIANLIDEAKVKAEEAVRPLLAIDDYR